MEESTKSALIHEQAERLASLRSRVSRYRTLLRAERDKGAELVKVIRALELRLGIGRIDES